MKKIFSIFAAMLVALVANAAVININSGTADALRLALNDAASGDVIVMAAGTYVESPSNYIYFIGKEVKVMAEEGAEVIVVPKVPIRFKEGARAEFVNIKFDCGHLSDVNSYSEMIVPADDTPNKRVILRGCEFYGWKQDNAIIHATSSRRLDSVVIDNCYFHDNMKSCVFMENTNMVGLQITNCTFANIATKSGYSAGVVDVRATAGSVVVDHCTFYNALAANTDYAAVGKVKTTDAVVSNCIFALPESTDGMRAIHMDGGQANNCLVFNYTNDGGTGIRSAVTQNNTITGQDPLFRDAANGNYLLEAGSPAFGAGTDGSDLGDPRWVPQLDYYLVGNMSSWGPNAKYKLAKNPANEGEYMIDLFMEAGSEFKIAMSDGQLIDDANWYPTGMGNNYQITASGEYIVYFRPDGQGGDGWHEGYIFAEKQVMDLGPWEAWFGDAGWQPEEASYLLYDAAAQKAEVHILQNKSGQWQAQVKYHGPSGEDGKCYRVALKMKANHDIGGVTLKWQEDNNVPNVIYENQSINLGENEEYIFDEVVKAVLGEQGGNGILILDLGWAQAGDIIEIYGVTIEETECPEPEKYYLVGTFNEWAATPDYLMAENAAAAGEYMLDTKLTEGDELKVVGISGEDENYYPAGLGNAYVVDAAHAGWVTVYFRPAGNAEWAEFGGYFYINVRQGIENVQGDEVQCTKVVENGHLMILKNGMKYNAQGALVK